MNGTAMLTTEYSLGTITLSEASMDKKATKEDDFRDYENSNASVAAFYKDHHEKQTLEHALIMEEKYSQLNNGYMGIWEALELLSGLVDESDPDTEMPQIMHALQSAEAARRDGQPRWFILTALIHDLGKILAYFGEPQWTVVGDTFPLGCAFADKIIFRKFLLDNPDAAHPVYSTKHGIYQPYCGLSNVHFSYGHDTYLYHVCKNYLPAEASYIIRHHSFYAWHNQNEYSWLMDQQDQEMLPWVQRFSRYDLYSKGMSAPNINDLKPYYLDLINEYFPPKIRW